MSDGVFPLVELAIQVCADRGVRDFVVAPGSRSAPITTALARRPDFTLRVVYDERAAGYLALGMAQQLHRPVGLVCTSGTAAVNFGPAVVEAFYGVDNLRFLKPTFIGDTLHAESEIINMRDKGDKHGVVTAQLWAVNQRSERVLSCEFTLLIRRERLIVD